jgi:integrase
MSIERMGGCVASPPLDSLPVRKPDAIVASPAVSTRKRGKCMSRRKGQNPKLVPRYGMYTFRYRVDVAGMNKRLQRRVELGPLGSMTQSEAKRRIKEFLVTHQINTGAAKIPSVAMFAQAVKYYREVFAPRSLRASTFDVADMHIRKHLEPDWKDTPVDHINIDVVNEWAWKKRDAGLSWTMIKNVLRTMQRVLSCYSKREPPFSLSGLTIPERDELRMRIKNRQAVSITWDQAKQLTAIVRKLDSLDGSRKSTYSTAFLLAAATGLRRGELFALKAGDVSFKEGLIRVDESVDRKYVIGDCKNTAAYRTVVITDQEGREALRELRQYLGVGPQHPDALLFKSGRGVPLRETNVLHDGLHPALAALGLPKAGMHAFRRGCNRRWELVGMSRAVLRQMMGHSSSAMTERYTSEIPIEQVRLVTTNVTSCDQQQFEEVA